MHNQNKKASRLGCHVIPSERASRGISFGGDFRTRRIVVCLHLPKRQARHTPCFGTKLVAKTIINRFGLEFRFDRCNFRERKHRSQLIVTSRTKKATPTECAKVTSAPVEWSITFVNPSDCLGTLPSLWRNSLQKQFSIVFA